MDKEFYKEVHFHEYCNGKEHKCKHFGKKLAEPCYECLSEPTNYATHRPVKFEEVSKKEKKNGQI